MYEKEQTIEILTEGNSSNIDAVACFIRSGTKKLTKEIEMLKMPGSLLLVYHNNAGVS